MDFYDDNDYGNGWYDNDDLREMGDREAWEDAQAEMWSDEADLADDSLLDEDPFGFDPEQGEW